MQYVRSSKQMVLRFSAFFASEADAFMAREQELERGGGRKKGRAKRPSFASSPSSLSFFPLFFSPKNGLASAAAVTLFRPNFFHICAESWRNGVHALLNEDNNNNGIFTSTNFSNNSFYKQVN